MPDCSVDPLSQPYCAFQELKNLVALTVNWMIVIGAVSSLVFILVGAFKYIQSGGDPKATENARQTLTYAAVGLIVCVSAYLIVRAIGFMGGGCVPGIQC